MEPVNPEDARELVASHSVAVIDLRDEEGWLEGHIPGAHRADPDDLDATLEGIPEDRRLLVVCEDGERSAAVARKLDEGDREAIALEGGMSAWLGDGLPSQPSADFEPGPEGPIEEEPEEAAGEADEGGTDAPGDRR